MAQDYARGLLLIDDEPAQGRLVSAIAVRAGWQVYRQPDCAAAVALLTAPDAPAVHAALIDQWAPDSIQVTAAITALHDVRPALPVVMIATTNMVETAVAAIRAGAADYLVKPISPANLIKALENAASTGTSGGELRPLTEKLSEPVRFDELVGSTPVFHAVRAVAAKAARADLPVLIEGERGVGKQALAHAIHTASARRHQPFIAVNCATVPDNLIESELFGHESGAFPGAFDLHIGAFAAADGGTLFIAEVGKLPPAAQIKLLHALQTGEVQALGGNRRRRVNVRIIAASGTPLADAVASDYFREDLYCLLNSIQLPLPALRDRSADIPKLVRHFLDRVAPAAGLLGLDVEDDVIGLLVRYNWPGNVRQLQNTLFRAAVLCGQDTLTTGDFPQICASLNNVNTARHPPATARAHLAPLQTTLPVALFDEAGHIRSLQEVEADLIRLAVRHYHGHMTEVARRLGIGRSTLYRKLAELGISDAA
jgi:DNA-binding NtrC family response regulator